jgi:hypothetical protein
MIIYSIFLGILILFWIMMIAEALTMLITDEYDGIVLLRKLKKLLDKSKIMLIL